MGLSAGTRLGPYQILQPVGAGGMGEVYKAIDTRLDRTVAIKVLSPALAADPQFRERFDREARSISSLDHPNICALYDVGREAGCDFIVMPYLEGESLADLLSRTRLSVEQAVAIAIQIADALEVAHREGIVHRDLKPGNVMIQRVGGSSSPPVAKLLDFGLAKSVAAPIAQPEVTAGATVTTPLTARGAILGTFQYMAPEQIEGRGADQRSDLWALGCMLYEMLTATRAFEARNAASLIAAVLEHEPPPVSARVPLVTPQLDHIVARCLAKDAERRWQSAADVAEELRWASRHLHDRATQPARRSALTLLPWVLAAGAVIVAAALAITVARRPAAKHLQVFHAAIPMPRGAVFQFFGDRGGPPVISPDGRNVAFVAADEHGANRMFVHSLETAADRMLAGTEGGNFPFWSADSRWVGFFADRKMKRVNILDGSVQTICDAAQGRGGTWSRDNVIVFEPDYQAGLFRVDASGGTPTPVTTIDTTKHTSHRWPYFLPDGRHVIYLAIRHGASRNESEVNAIYVASVDGKDNRRLVQTSANAAVVPGWILFLREDRTLMAQRFDDEQGVLNGDPVPIAANVGYDPATWRGMFDVSATGVIVFGGRSTVRMTNLVWLDRTGKQQPVTTIDTVVSNVDLSPDGRAVAIDIGDPGDIWNLDLQRGIRTPLTFDREVPDNAPVWSRDGQWIAYGVFDLSSRRRARVVRRRANGIGGEEVLFERKEPGEFVYPVDWTPDGKLLICVVGTLDRSSEGNIMLLPLNGERRMIPLVQTPAREYDAQLSPDGRWMAYVSEESGARQIFVVPFSPDSGEKGLAAKWQVSTDSGFQPRWRQDGKELFFLTADNRMMSATVAAAGSAFTVTSVQPLFTFNPSLIGWAYDVRADGQRFLVNSLSEREQPPLSLLINWQAALPK